MRFVSTRNPEHYVPLTTALEDGLSPDGGLYIPESLPQLSVPAIDSNSLPQEAHRFLEPFFEGDRLLPQLEAICQEAFTFPCPLVSLTNGHRVLELFHGPTAAFKDFGARFLAACLTRAPIEGPKRTRTTPRTILVATSGDTGGAVAAAFAERPDHQVWILFPEGGVSSLQEAQLTSWGERVLAFGVKGSFDDCQRIAKEAFLRPELRSGYGLTSANSINIGRLLPQAAYIWAAARSHQRLHGSAMKAIIPTGNLGHGLAALWAKQVGAPIADIVFAVNANRTVVDYLATGAVEPRCTISTIANAMDVSLPSNLERVRTIKDLDQIHPPLRAFTYSDESIRAGIQHAESDWGVAVCPHTACAVLACGELADAEWTVFATAHPAKFRSVVDPLLAQPLPTPKNLAEIYGRPQRKMIIDPTLEALIEGIQQAHTESAPWVIHD